MNSMNRLSLVGGLLVGLMVVIMGGFNTAARAESVSNSDPVTVTASFDQKYLLPDYIAYSGGTAGAQRALAIQKAAAFDANFLTPGSLVHSLKVADAYAQTVRWQAMADYYARHDLLTDNFDYAEAQEVQAARWQAMADYYARHDLLTDNFDYAEAQAAMAARWQAMADYYAAHGSLNIPASALAEAPTGR